MTNNNCDGGTDGRCSPNPEVRVLPYDKTSNGNLIVCRACYTREMIFRRQRNFDLAKDCQYDLPSWESLRIYETT